MKKESHPKHVYMRSLYKFLHSKFPYDPESVLYKRPTRKSTGRYIYKDGALYYIN